MGEFQRKAAIYVAALKPYQKPLRLAWDVLNLGVIGLNSFILLYFKCGYGDGMNQVVCFGGTAYAFVLLVQTLFLRKMPEKRQKAVYQTKKIFRLIYTALYLTVIMLNVISVTEVSTEGQEVLLSYYGVLFIWVSLWGTNCLWLRRAAGKAAEWHRRENRVAAHPCEFS